MQAKHTVEHRAEVKFKSLKVTLADAYAAVKALVEAKGAPPDAEVFYDSSNGVLTALWKVEE